MLVLTRKVGEEIRLPGQEVVLKILSIEGSRVRMGISAPADVSVHRYEVWERIRRELAASDLVQPSAHNR
jgi:carbon storage regulator